MRLATFASLPYKPTMVGTYKIAHVLQPASYHEIYTIGIVNQKVVYKLN